MLVSIYTSNETLEHRHDGSGAGRAGIKNPGVHHGWHGWDCNGLIAPWGDHSPRAGPKQSLLSRTAGSMHQERSAASAQSASSA